MDQCSAYVLASSTTIQAKMEGALIPPCIEAPPKSLEIQDNQSNLSPPKDTNSYLELTKCLQDYRNRESTSALCKRAYEESNSKVEYREPLAKATLQMESKFKLPNLGHKYNGASNVSDHVANYHTVTQLQGTTDNILCRAFSMTIKKGMRSWYNRLIWVEPLLPITMS